MELENSMKDQEKDSSPKRIRSVDSESSYEFDDVDIDDEYEKILSLPFELQNVALVIEGKRLHLKREQLTEVSPVFNKMFSSKQFKEATSTEVPLPDKKMSHFLRFLRCVLPGFQDELDDYSVHHILPLADEYQTEDLLKKIDAYLCAKTRKEGDLITSKQIVKNILEAEQYRLKNYLDACVVVAARKLCKVLHKIPEYCQVSKDTQIRILTTRCYGIDTIIDTDIHKLNCRPIETQIDHQWSSYNSEVAKRIEKWQAIGKEIVDKYMKKN